MYCQVFQDSWSQFKRILVVYLGMGMKLGGMKMCGDYMFSGYIIIMIIVIFIVIECKLCLFINLYYKILKGVIKKNECFFKVVMRYQLLVFIFFVDIFSWYCLFYLVLWLYCFCGMWVIFVFYGYYMFDVVVVFYILLRIFMYY